MFTTKGTRPEWQLVFDQLKPLQPGEVISYEELDATLGRAFRADRAPLYTAQRHLEKDAQRTVEVERGVGYRVVEASEHERLARSHQLRGKRQVRKARSKVSSARRHEMNREQAQRLDVMEHTLARHESMLRHNAARIEHVDDQRKQSERRLSSDVAALAEKVEALRARAAAQEPAAS